MTCIGPFFVAHFLDSNLWFNLSCRGVLIKCTGADGQYRAVHPYLYTVVADHPEQSLQTCTFTGSNVQRPCSSCLVRRQDITVLETQGTQWRTEAGTAMLLQHSVSNPNLLLEFSLHPMKVASCIHLFTGISKMMMNTLHYIRSLLAAVLECMEPRGSRAGPSGRDEWVPDSSCGADAQPAPWCIPTRTSTNTELSASAGTRPAQLPHARSSRNPVRRA